MSIDGPIEPHSESADTMTGMSPRVSGGDWTRLRRQRLTRRSLLRASLRAGVGAAGLALVGCSDDGQPEQPEPPQQQQAMQQQDSPPEPPEVEQQSARQAQPEQVVQLDDEPEPPSERTAGGIMRIWLPVERHDRWDPHRSRYRYTQAALSLMYNRLVRPASVSSGELQADLCALPEMPDETTYNFNVEPAARFWALEPTNGRAFTAQDIAWNVERQRSAIDGDGLPDPHFFRRAAYDRTASHEATSDTSITFTTAAPDAAYLAGVHASPYAWMTSPEAAELYGDDWRDDPSDVMRSSGTGPYAPRHFNGFELTVVRSETWWRDESAWVDAITFTTGDTNNIVSLYDAAAFDRADFPLTNEAVEAIREQHPEHPRFEVPLDAAVELLAPMAAEAESPLSDPRVVRAIGIAIDRPQLIERLYNGHGRASGPLPWYLNGWSLSERLLSTFAGYRDNREADLAEVSQLISAAGGSGAIGTLPLVVADLFEGYFPGSGEAVRSMTSDATGLEVELEHRGFAEAIDQLRSGERFCFLGWGAVPRQADPTDDWHATLHSAGERNWSDDSSPEVDALIDQMRMTFNRGARQDIGHQVQEILLRGDAPQWQIPLINGIQLGLHQPWLHPDPRLFEYAWSTERLSTSWLDTELDSFPAGRELPPLEDETEAGG